DELVGLVRLLDAPGAADHGGDLGTALEEAALGAEGDFAVIVSLRERFHEGYDLFVRIGVQLRYARSFRDGEARARKHRLHLRLELLANEPPNLLEQRLGVVLGDVSELEVQ